MDGKKGFYGWRIVSAACALQFLISAFMMQSFGAYVAVLRESFGWSKTALATAAAIQQIEGALLGPVQGWFIDRFGARNLVRAGVICFSAGMILFSQVETLLLFYVSFFIIALGTSMAGYFSLTVVIVHWFEKQRGRALSMLNLGFALGGVTVPILAWALVAFGWRATAFSSGVMALVIGWPLAGVIRNRPRDVGAVIDGDPAAEAKGSASGDASGAASNKKAGEATSTEETGFTVREAVRTSAFWLIALGHGFALLVVGAINVHAITFMKEGMGYSVEQAALVIGLQTAAQVGGIALGWFVADRFEKRKIAAVCMFVHMIALLLFTFAIAWPMVIAFALLHGCAWGLRGSFMQALRADFFGRRHFGMIMGFSSIIVVMGNVGGPLLTAIVADATGSYRAGFTTVAMLAGFGSTFFLLLRKPQLPPRPQTQM